MTLELLRIESLLPLTSENRVHRGIAALNGLKRGQCRLNPILG